jgi:co-chaperonin GroES (HSP10)
MKHDVDPKKVILEKIGSLKGFELFGSQVLLGMYERPKITQSGIHLTDQTRKEDEFQGKAGLVLALGPAAFVSDENHDFMGQKVAVGDWLSIWVSDGRSIKIRGQLCRIVHDDHVRLKIPAPDYVF